MLGSAIADTEKDGSTGNSSTDQDMERQSKSSSGGKKHANTKKTGKSDKDKIKSGSNLGKIQEEAAPTEDRSPASQVRTVSSPPPSAPETDASPPKARFDENAPEVNSPEQKFIEKRLSSDPRKAGSLLGFLAMILPMTGFWSAAGMLLWSTMGYAEDTIAFLEENAWLFNVFGGCGILGLLLLYLLDFYWPAHISGVYFSLREIQDVWGRMFFAIFIICLILMSCFMVEDYPMVPLIVTIFSSPVCILILRVAVGLPTEYSLLSPLLSDTDGDGRITPQDVDVQKVKKMFSSDHLSNLVKQLQDSEKDADNFFQACTISYFLNAAVGFGVSIPWAIENIADTDVLKDRSISIYDREKIFLKWFAPGIIAGSNLMFFFLLLVRVYMGRSWASGNKGFESKLKEGARPATAGRITMIGKSSEHETKVAKKMTARMTQVLNGQGFRNEGEKQDYIEMHANSISQLTKVIKIIGVSIFFLIGSVYVTAELVAADSHIAMLFQGFLGCFFLTFFAFVAISFRRLLTNMRGWLEDMPLFQSAKAIAENDWVKAAALWFVLPIIPALLLLSCTNQCTRRCRGIAKECVDEAKKNSGSSAPPEKEAESKMPPVTKAKPRPKAKALNKKFSEFQVEEPMETGEEQWLTWRVHKMVKMMQNWDLLGMVLKLYLIALLTCIYVLSPRLLNVFLAWLRSILSEFEFGMILVMVWLTGMLCFMLPPVPGVPVYIFGGVIVADQCPYGFWPGVGICIGICFGMKLCACAMQQKLIGESLGSSIAIKQQVGIHKSGIRAIECVLRARGWTVGKVAILCGGPDWPTSVMAGILRLPLYQMELGTVPIIFFIAPCVMTGSFYLRQGESELWSNIGSLMLMLTLVVNMILWALAAWAIQEQFDTNCDLLTRPMTKYLELDWRDYRSEEIAKVTTLTFQDLPCCLRAVNIFFMWLAVHVSQFLYWAPDTAFGEFAVTGDMADLVWLGEDGLFKYPGAVALGIILFCSMVCFMTEKWKECRVRVRRKEEERRLDGIAEQWKADRTKECDKAEAEAKQNKARENTSLLSQRQSRQSAARHTMDKE